MVSMGVIERKFHPVSFCLDELNICHETYNEFFYLNHNRYEEIHNLHTNEVRYCRNLDELPEKIYKAKSKNIEKLTKNRFAFWKGSEICVLDIYLLKDGRILPVVTAYFTSEEEANEFLPDRWFGNEVSLHFYDEEKLFQTLAE